VEIRDLEYFLVCCRTGSFTAAAREVHIVQSAMSSAVARLEHELGVSLFDRSVTPVAVTGPGRALQAGARRVLEAVQATRDEVAAISGRVAGPVILGCTLHTGPLDLAAVLAALRDRHPGVIVQLRQSITGSAGNLDAVADGAMDIALTAGSGPPRGVRLSPLVSEPLVFVCPDDHPLSRHPRVTPADLAGQNILRFPPGWGIRAAVDAVLGPDPSAIEIADYALMLKLIRDGFGTTLLPASALTADHPSPRPTPASPADRPGLRSAPASPADHPGLRSTPAPPASPADHPGLQAVPVDDPRLTWRLSAAVSATRQPTAAAAALLTALTEAAAGLPATT
jgi:DNA-binding transcriptional LysR family regulator